MRRDWNPFEQLEQFFDQTALRPMVNTEFRLGSLASDITIDVADYEDEVVITADVPGYEKENIDLQLAEDTLIIRAESNQETTQSDDDAGTFVHQERHHSRVERRIPLHTAVLGEEATSTYSNGVLTVTLPKATPEEETGTHIDIE